MLSEINIDVIFYRKKHLTYQNSEYTAINQLLTMH